jgi:RHS repeat-associated protein
LNSVVYQNGYSEEYTYYKDNQLRTLVNKTANGTVIESYSYNYDNAHNMLSKTDNKGTTSYTYDELNRLKTVTEPSGKVTIYTYTSAGNRNTETVVEGSNTTVKVYTYDSLNRLLSIIVSLNTVTVENTAYTYDNNGNQLTSRVDSYVNGLLQSSSVTTNVYENLNQLIQTTTPDNTTIKNIYNGEGLRVGKQVGNSSTKYLYSSDKVVLELDGNGNLIARNIYGINLLERITESNKAYYFYNGHADTTKLIAQDGTVLNNYYYDAFGNITDSNENMDNPYRYAGYQYDKETKTYYVIARIYDPSTGRFLQEDSYSGDINDPLSLNLYTYCHNEPNMYNDPTGHFFESLKNIWGGIKEAASSAWDVAKSVGSVIADGVKEAVSTVGSFVAGTVASTFETMYKPMYAAGKAVGKLETKLTGTSHITKFVEKFKKENMDVTVDWINNLASNMKAKKAGNAVGSFVTEGLLILGVGGEAKAASTAVGLSGKVFPWLENAAVNFTAGTLTTAIDEYADGKSGNQILHNSLQTGLIATAGGMAIDGIPLLKEPIKNGLSKIGSALDSFGSQPALATAGAPNIGENLFSRLSDMIDNSNMSFIKKGTKGTADAKLITNKFPDELLPANGRAIDYTIENGKINGLNGQRNVDFVIDSNGELKIGSKHHYLGNAEDVKAGGQLKLDGQGRIRRIDNLSGHYRPTVDEAMNYPELFRQNGLNVKNSWLELYDIKVDADGFVESVNKAVSKKIK